MSIDFTLPPDVEETRARVREFMDEVVRRVRTKVDVWSALADVER